MRSLLFVAVGSLLVSGCVSSESSAGVQTVATSAQPATATEETGGIDGTVLSEEQLPIKGVMVALVEAGQQTESATDGKFSFSGLEAGTYSIAAQALGYESVARKVDVVAGQVASVSLVLKALQVTDVRQENFQYKGFLGWGVVTPYVRLPSWILDPSQDKNYFQNNDTKGVMTVVDALVWQSSAPMTAKRLGIRFYYDEKASTDLVSSRSPAILRADEPKTKKSVGHYVYTPFSTLDPEEVVQVYYQQRFDIYSSFFYGEAAPETFSPLPP